MVHLLAFVERDGDDLRLSRQLRRCGLDIKITFVRTRSAYARRLQSRAWDIVIVAADAETGKTLFQADVQPIDHRARLLILSAEPVENRPPDSLWLRRRDIDSLHRIVETLSADQSDAATHCLSVHSASDDVMLADAFPLPTARFRCRGLVSAHATDQFALVDWSGPLDALLGDQSTTSGNSPERLFARLRLQDRRVVFERINRLIARPGRAAWPCVSELTHRRRRLWLSCQTRVVENHMALEGAVIDLSAAKPVFLPETAEHRSSDALSITLAREEERERIGQEIHDALGNALIGARLDLTWAIAQPAVSDPVRRRLLRAMRTLEEAVESVRQIARDLRPHILRDFGLVEALRHQAETFQKQSGLDIEFSSNRSYLALDEKQALTFFRIQQEALTNVVKHAAATHATIVLTVGDGEIRLAIADDGVGIADADREKPKSMGLRSMAERAEQFGGRCLVRNRSKGGLCVTATFPYTP